MVQFSDVGAATGLDFVNVSGSAEQSYILETMSTGVAFLDCDQDGFLDLFVVNGTRLEDTPDGAGNRLYHNEEEDESGSGGGRGGRIFHEVEVDFGEPGWGMGCAVGDYDNDGDPDIYVTYWGPNRLYRNDWERGEGQRFPEIAAEAGIADDGWGSSAAFADLDGDGLLDLYVANYLEFDLATPPGDGQKHYYKGVEVFYGPKGMDGQSDRLYRNAGGGTFADVSATAGLTATRYPALGVTFGDWDGDGDQDIYVANDGAPNQLYRNDGNWQLTEVAALVGASHSEDGRTQAGMGVHGGDFDNDGDLDLFVTNFEDDVNTLYRNNGRAGFTDATYEVGLGGTVRPYLGWGAGFVDFDNDGWLDLFVANGHLYPQLDRRHSGVRYGQRNLLYHNREGHFVEVGAEAGSVWALEKVSRATAVGDFDNDGDIDLFFANINDAPTFLQNEGGNQNQWLGLLLVGTGESNRDAIGARVRVVAGDLTQIREVQRGYGFQAQHDRRLLFGLGKRLRVERVEIDWPSGRHQVLEAPPLRRYLEIQEGSDEVVAALPVVPPAAPMPKKGGSARDPVAAELTPTLGNPSWKTADYVQAGKAMYGEGRYGEARAAFEEALRLNPDSLQVYANLAVVLFAGMGRDEEAIPLLEHIVRRDSLRVDIHFLLGKVYMSLNRLPSAIDALKKTTRMSPLSWEAHNWLGLAYLRTDNLMAAAASFQRASRGGPWMSAPHLNQARIYESLGRAKAAEKERRIAEQLIPLEREVDRHLSRVQVTPRDTQARGELGMAYAAQGRLAEAVREWRRVLQLAPRHPQAADWIRQARTKMKEGRQVLP